MGDFKEINNEVYTLAYSALSGGETFIENFAIKPNFQGKRLSYEMWRPYNSKYDDKDRDVFGEWK